MVGGAGNDVFSYLAGDFTTSDVRAGDTDTIGDADAGDVLDIFPSLAGLLSIGGALIGDGATLPGALEAGSTNIAFDNANDLLMVDINGDGVFNQADDFAVHLVGVASVTYAASSSSFSFTLDP